MTELLLNREKQTADATLGRFFFANECLYFTCEDLQRKEKVWGKTAIPCGRYQILMQPSPHFGRDMPNLQDVPNYEGVLIHWGNTSEDTDGCILIGLERADDGVLESKAAFNNFLPRLEAALLNGDVWITVESAIPVVL